MKRLGTAIVLVVLLGVVSPSGQGTILFRANVTAGAWPNLGFTMTLVRFLNERYTIEHVANAGPSGQGVVRYAGRTCTSCSYYGGQYDWGWTAMISAGDPASGTSRFYRWRMKMTGNHRGLQWGSGGAGGMQHKLVIIGSNCGSNCRFILTYQVEPNGGGIRNFRLQKDGGSDLVDTGFFPNDVWLNVQVELAVGSGGGYRMWVNNNSQGSPTAQRMNIAFNGTNHKEVRMGAFMNDGLASGGTHGFDWTDFEVGTAFAANWHGGGTPPPQPTAPTAPASIRVVGD